jgi:hypothetical protein
MPELSRDPLERPLASAANVWLAGWLSDVAKSSDGAASALLSAEMLSAAIIAKKKIRKAINIVARFKIKIPPCLYKNLHYHISNYLLSSHCRLP